jgi:hypothetical protein
LCPQIVRLEKYDIFVKMFDDRLVVESPGAFPPLSRLKIFLICINRETHTLWTLYFI